MRYSLTTFILCGLMPMTAWAQERATATRPATAPTTQPVQIDETYEAEVIKVQGKVSYAVPDAEGKRGPWKRAEVGVKLPAGTEIRTMIRARLTLKFGDDTVIQVERATLASIDSFHRTGDTKFVRLGLGHGAVRGGTAETTLRSDLTIAAPTATLSKRGTIGFRIEYTPVVGRFRVSLERKGLVQALNQVTGKSMTIGPGQYVTQAMVQWVETAKFDRYVPIVDVYGLTDAEEKFQALLASGLATVEPGAGAATKSLTGTDASRAFGQLVPSPIPPSDAGLLIRARRPVDRNEGNFGTGPINRSSLLFKQRKSRR
jgi:hypothetical protein